jgi:hypothetical protein
MADLSSYINITANTVVTSNLSTTGNVVSNSIISTTGNITGNYILGNGSQLTGLPATYGNANVVANLAALGSNPVSTTGNITGNYILGNGSQLTGLPATYGNANVATFLAAYGSNTLSTSGNVTTGNVSAGNLLSGGLISTTGNITTAGNFVGNGAALTNVTVSVAGNVVGTQSNVTLVAGSFTATFDNTGILTLPTMGGDEGGELNLGIPATNTTLQNRVNIDVFQDRLRFFEGSANAKGVYIDLAQSAAGVGTLLNNRVSGLVNAGTFVTMDFIKATITTSGNRGLSLATTTGTLAYSIGGTYGMATPASGGSAGTGTLTTTPTASIFNWGFVSTGDTATYILTDTTNSRAYRIITQIGASFNNNMISIERLI